MPTETLTVDQFIHIDFKGCDYKVKGENYQFPSMVKNLIPKLEDGSHACVDSATGQAHKHFCRRLCQGLLFNDRKVLAYELGKSDFEDTQGNFQLTKAKKCLNLAKGKGYSGYKSYSHEGTPVFSPSQRNCSGAACDYALAADWLGQQHFTVSTGCAPQRNLRFSPLPLLSSWGSQGFANWISRLMGARLGLLLAASSSSSEQNAECNLQGYAFACFIFEKHGFWE